MTTVFIEGGCAVEDGVIGQAHVLRHEFATELLDVAQHLVVPVRELPVARHDIDAQPVAGANHVASACPVRCPRALPGITTIQQQRVAGPGLISQLFDERRKMREAAHLAIALRRFREIEVTDGMGKPGSLSDAGILEQGVTHQVRWPALGVADAQVDVGFAEIHGQELRVTIREMDEPRLSERRRSIQIGTRRSAAARTGSGSRSDAGYRQQAQKFPPIHGPVPASLQYPRSPCPGFAFGLYERGLGLELRLLDQRQCVVEIAVFHLCACLLEKRRRFEPLVTSVRGLLQQAFRLRKPDINISRHTGRRQQNDSDRNN